MSTYKNTSGDYVITLANGSGNLTVYGNLEVQGNITYIHTTDLKIDDPFITVAANNTGIITSMGMLAQTGNAAWAGLRYSANVAAWQVSSSVDENGAPLSPYANLVTTFSNITVGNSSNTQIQFNKSYVIDGDPNLTFDWSISKLTLTGHQVYGNIVSTPSPIANSVATYHKQIGEGDTGLYVISNDVDDELISTTQSKKFAIIYGIIF